MFSDRFSAHTYSLRSFAKFIEFQKNLARIFHGSLAATTDMAVLPDVLGCRPLRRTVQVRPGPNPAVPRDELPGGTPILFALAALRSVPQAGSQFRDLATAIHEIYGLVLPCTAGSSRGLDPSLSLIRLLPITTIQQWER
jgi:hypothetical protein